eukprot:3689253-Rhodomonas_salina.1
MKAMNSFVGLCRGDNLALDVQKHLQADVRAELEYWLDTLSRFALSANNGGGDTPNDAAQQPLAAGSTAPSCSGHTERKADAVEGCRALLRELLSHDLVSRELASEASSALLFRRFVQRLLDRLGIASYSTGWSLRQDFMSGLRESVESKDIPARLAKGLARTFDQLYERYAAGVERLGACHFARKR